MAATVIGSHDGRRGEIVGASAAAYLLREVDKLWPGLWIAPRDQVLLEFTSVAFAQPGPLLLAAPA